VDEFIGKQTTMIRKKSICGRSQSATGYWLLATGYVLATGYWLLATGYSMSADGKYAIKQARSPIPQQISEPIRKVLDEDSVQLQGENGSAICELWFARELPVKATPAQIRSGLTYREMEESTVIGAVRFDKPFTDYRKQKIKPGVYTLRLGFQPMDGDHMGTAPYNEFCLLVPAKLDEKPDIIDPKELREVSAKSTGGSHPGVMLLFPNESPEDAAKLLDKGSDTWVLALRRAVSVDGKKADAAFGIALTLVGHTTAE
jgi:hypothetical protein